jgi:DNA polymerase-3 subunit delta'
LKISEINKKILKIRPSSLLVKVSVMSDLTDLANKLAQIYLCKYVTNEEPCGSCKNCRLLLSGTHPDFVSIFSEDSQEENIKISEINNLNSFFQLSSNQGGSRLFFVGVFEVLN